MRLICLRVVAILSVALYLVPTGAHLFELPAKMAMSRWWQSPQRWRSMPGLVQRHPGPAKRAGEA